MARPRSFSRIRKRTFVVTGLTTLAVLLVAGLLMLYAILQAGPDDLVTVTINEGQSRTAVLGSGISLDQAEASGMLRDASFEPLIFRQTLTIYSGDATTLTVSSEEASSGQFGDGFFDGAAARVMSRTDTGLVLKKTAKVLNYGINRVGIFTDVNLPGDMPAGLAILAFARSGDVSLAVGEQGLIITNVSGQTPQIAESGLESDLTGVCATDSGYLVCSADGDLLASADGQSWQIIAQYPGKPLRAIAATPEGLYVAVGDAGTIIVGLGDVSTPLQPLTSANLTDIACSGESFSAVGEDGTILTSRTGVLWQSRNISAETDWLAADYRDGRFVTTGSAGAIAISDDGSLFTLLTHNAEAAYTDIVMLSRRQLIVLDENGGFAISNDSGATWLSSSIQTGMHSMVISLAGKDKILSADDRGSLGLAQLVAEIQLDSALKDSQYQAGDLIFLEKATMAIPDSYLAANTAGADYKDPWQHFGPGSSTRVFGEASPGGGQASMLMNSDSGMTGKTTIVSQIIDTAKLGNSLNDLYEIELWMKQSEINDRSVRVWLTGPFKSVGTVFANVGTTWKKYSFTFFLPIKIGRAHV